MVATFGACYYVYYATFGTSVFTTGVSVTGGSIFYFNLSPAVVFLVILASSANVFVVDSKSVEYTCNSSFKFVAVNSYYNYFCIFNFSSKSTY